MKTAAEFIKEIGASEDLQRELTSIGKEYAEIGDFLKRHDCAASAEEFVGCLKSLFEGELTDDDANDVAGGFSPWWGKSNIYKNINLPQQKGI